MRDLLATLAPSWQGTPELAELQRVIALALDRLDADVELWRAQLSIDTATQGLESWERAVGIVPDLSLSLDTRRAKVKAKLMGLGVTTAEVVRVIVESLCQRKTTVTEGHSPFTVRITMDGILTDPPTLSVIRHSLAEVMPAHLAREFSYRASVGTSPWHTAGVIQKIERHKFRLEATTT